MNFPVLNKKVAFANGEFGGMLLTPEHMNPPQKEWAPGKCHGYLTANTPDEWNTNFESFLMMITEPEKGGFRNRGLSASVYTQLTDTETECNGIFSYDRILKGNASLILAAARSLTAV